MKVWCYIESNGAEGSCTLAWLLLIFFQDFLLFCGRALVRSSSPRDTVLPLQNVPSLAATALVKALIVRVSDAPDKWLCQGPLKEGFVCLWIVLASFSIPGQLCWAHGELLARTHIFCSAFFDAAGTRQDRVVSYLIRIPNLGVCRAARVECCKLAWRKGPSFGTEVAQTHF